jgi:hypothetical protein
MIAEPGTSIVQDRGGDVSTVGSSFRPRPEAPPGGCPSCGGLATGITVTTSADGTVVASIELRGTLCAPAVPAVLAMIEDLHALGATDVCIDLSRTTTCDV